MYRSSRTRRVRRGLSAVFTILAVALAGLIPVASVAGAEDPTDMVLDWNAIAIQAIGNPPSATPPGLGQPPPLAPIHLAMVHGAIYDAVNAIDGGHTAYLNGLPSASANASQAAAVAAAARDVLVALPPGSAAVTASVDGLYQASLAEIEPGPARDAGVSIGQAAAAAMVASRVGDGRFGSALFDVSNEPGKWRPVPPLSNNVLAWAGAVDPFVLKSPAQLRTAGPLDITSPEYAVEFNEVKAKGAKVGSTRTEAESLLASFVSANPFVFMYRGLREIAVARGLSTAEQARLFAMVGLSSADAMIACWNDKDHWNVWRPQTAIQEAAADGNPATDPDPTWESLYATPGYPDHPSGYNCFTAALWYSAGIFFGSDKASFQLTSPGTAPLAGSTRTYTRFSDVVDDTIDGRIFTGFHFRTPDVQGAWIGKKAAQWLARHYFQAVRD
jgi:hypothetical protein